MNHDNRGRETDFKLDEEKKTKREGERERSREHSMMIRMMIMIKSKKKNGFGLPQLNRYHLIYLQNQRHG